MPLPRTLFAFVTLFGSLTAFAAEPWADPKLKVTDGRFARLLQDYDEINDQVAGAESRQAPMSDEAETDLRKKRAMLKDEIARALAGG